MIRETSVIKVEVRIPEMAPPVLVIDSMAD